MNIGSLFNSAKRGTKSFFSINVDVNQKSRAELRMEKMDKRLEDMHKQSILSKDSAIRGTSGATSSRDMLTRSLGKKPEMTRGTSLARVNSTTNTQTGGMQLSSLPPKLPPMRPIGR